MFYKAIMNISNTIETKDYEILVSADENDKTMNNPQMRRFASQNKHIKIIYGNSESKIDAINRDLNQASNWDILVNMSDDMHFKVRSWDKKIIQQSKSVWCDSLDWLGNWNDGYVGSALPTMSIMGYDYFIRDNYIYHPSYKSFSCDAEQMFVAQARGRYHYFPEILFKHEHPANNRKMRSDSLYKVNAIHSKGDVENYFNRLNNDFYVNLPGPFPWDKYKTNV